ncbi:hypothetical protein BC826DRAFT_1186398 [Russula brevipes]|nr:hypothetical protein BC826DRAFT_1186398 [Russula brevipes]
MAPDNTPTPMRDTDIIIPLMGPTGIGKSSFIDRLTGDKGIKVGHGLGPQKPKIGIRCFSALNGRRVALGDTPSSEDSSGMTNSNVLDEIASSLKDSSEPRSSR